MKNLNCEKSKVRRIQVLVILILFFGIQAEAQLISTIVGDGSQGFNGDNIPATSSSLFGPMGICKDVDGNTYIADAGSHRIRKVNASTGIVTTVAGNGIQGFNGDNIPATSAELDNPYNVAVDVSGNIYIADQGSHRIRKVNSATGLITTIAGTGINGYNGDNIPANTAKINSPWGLALDAVGNIYFGDVFNARIRKITVSTGLITTIAGYGSSGYNGDNIQATSAKISWITGIFIDAIGNIYFCDMHNNRVRKVTISTGLISTIAGTGTAGYNGNNIQATSARLNSPMGLCKDNFGNILIADVNNNRIRKINVTTGIMSNVAGNGAQGYNGDNIPAAAAKLNFPYYVYSDNTNSFYISDYLNFRIRKVTAPGSLPIELLKFEVKQNKNISQINWTTTSEINNDFFTVERTSDGIYFSVIDSVKGAGNSNQEIDYGIIDTKPLTGLSYYRLKQIDFDGNFTYSNLTSLSFIKDSEFTVYPNPFIDKINVTGDVYLGIITDFQGRVVKTFQEEKTITVSNLSSGIYFISILSKIGGLFEIRKMIKE